MARVTLPDILSYAGDDVYIDIAVKDSLGAAQNITGWSIWFTAKALITDDDVAAVTQKTIGSGITVTNAVGGLATVHILPADTDQFQETGATLLYDIQVETAAQEIYTLGDGEWTLYESVTQATGTPLILGQRREHAGPRTIYLTDPTRMAQ